MQLLYDESTADYMHEMDSLKVRVTQVLNQLFGNEITAAEAVREMAGLGCEITFVPEAEINRYAMFFFVWEQLCRHLLLSHEMSMDIQQSRQQDKDPCSTVLLCK